jgi:hypothetical protein
MTWYANVNDLIGGWYISDRDQPASQVNTMEDCPPYVLADFMDEADAKALVDVLNFQGYVGQARWKAERGNCS